MKKCFTIKENFKLFFQSDQSFKRVAKFWPNELHSHLVIFRKSSIQGCKVSPVQTILKISKAGNRFYKNGSLEKMHQPSQNAKLPQIFITTILHAFQACLQNLMPVNDDCDYVENVPVLLHPKSQSLAEVKENYPST